MGKICFYIYLIGSQTLRGKPRYRLHSHILNLDSNKASQIRNITTLYRLAFCLWVPFLIIHHSWKGFIRNCEPSSCPPSPQLLCQSMPASSFFSEFFTRAASLRHFLSLEKLQSALSWSGKIRIPSKELQEKPKQLWAENQYILHFSISAEKLSLNPHISFWANQ